MGERLRLRTTRSKWFFGPKFLHWVLRNAPRIYYCVWPTVRAKCAKLVRTILETAAGPNKLYEFRGNDLRKMRFDATYQEVVEFMKPKRAAQTMETSSMEFDLLLEKVEAGMGMGSGAPDEFAAPLCMRIAGFPMGEKSRALPAFAMQRRFQRRQVKCVDYPGRVDVRRNGMSSRGPKWTRRRRQKTLRLG